MNYPLYRDSLCPKMWHMDEDGYSLDAEVRKGLSKIAQDFVDGLKKDYELNIKIYDVVIIGSVANYNWTNYSDVDLHIITDYSDLEMTPSDAQTLFDAIKVNWNNKHDIKMKGHDVEIYVQDKTHKPVSSAEYSVIQNKWIKEPTKEKPSFNKDLIKKKYSEYKNKINGLIQKHDENGLKKLLDKLYKFRQAGLDKGGELSEENIVFKILRAHGLLDKIKDSIAKIYDKKMSVTEIAPNYPIRINGDAEYQRGLEIVANAILKAAKQYGEFPDINPLLEKLASMFDKSVDEVHTDLARVYHKKTSVNETEIIDDGISSFDGKTVSWASDEDEGEFTLVPTDNETPRFFTVHGMKVYGAFATNPKGINAMKVAGMADDDPFMEKALVNLRHAVKHPEQGSGSKSIVRDLVKISVKRLFKSDTYDASKINVIIPFGSKSRLNYIVADEVKKYVPNAVILEDFLKKDKWKNVELSPIFWNLYNRKKKEGKDVSYYDYVIRDLNRRKETRGEEEFEIKKVGATNRMYYSMFYKVSEGYSVDLIKKIKGANVLLIDDTLEAGATLKDAHRAIVKFGPADVLTYIFLYGRNTSVPKAVNSKDIREDVSQEFANKIATSVYTFFVNKAYHQSSREGNTITAWERPTPKQMKYLQGKSGSFKWGMKNIPVYWIHDPHEQDKIKFTWNPF